MQVFVWGPLCKQNIYDYDMIKLPWVVIVFKNLSNTSLPSIQFDMIADLLNHSILFYISDCIKIIMCNLKMTFTIIH